MQQPEHTLRQQSAAQAAPRRLFGLLVVAGLHAVVIWAVAVSLANGLLTKLPEELKAEVVQQPPPAQKLPPPPPPEMVKPPPPFVPPPDIVIQNAAPVTTTITTQSTVPTPPPPPKPVGISSPVLAPSAGNNCANSYYPPSAIRMNQTGETLVTIHVGPDGNVESAEVADSSGHDTLDDAAIRCAQARFHFKPAMENGQPVAGTTKVRVVWKLQ